MNIMQEYQNILQETEKKHKNRKSASIAQIPGWEFNEADGKWYPAKKGEKQEEKSLEDKVSLLLRWLNFAILKDEYFIDDAVESYKTVKDATGEIVLDYMLDNKTAREIISDEKNLKDVLKELENLQKWHDHKRYVPDTKESDITPEGDAKVLMDFLHLPLTSASEVFKKFGGNGDEEYLYIEGSKKENKILFIAHADTVWDGDQVSNKFSNAYIQKGKVQSANKFTGIGADDRAGCAMLYLLKDSGHSILITNGEETGCKGARALTKNEALWDTINKNHNCMVELDRRGSSDYKCYSVGTKEFRDWIEKNIKGFTDAGRTSGTDICVLARDICGVNFSVGYYDEHTTRESLIISEWQNTLNSMREFANKEVPYFKLIKEPERPSYAGGWYDYGVGYYGGYSQYGGNAIKTNSTYKKPADVEELEDLDIDDTKEQLQDDLEEIYITLDKIKDDESGYRKIGNFMIFFKGIKGDAEYNKKIKAKTERDLEDEWEESIPVNYKLYDSDWLNEYIYYAIFINKTFTGVYDDGLF